MLPVQVCPNAQRIQTRPVAVSVTVPSPLSINLPEIVVMVVEVVLAVVVVLDDVVVVIGDVVVVEVLVVEVLVVVLDVVLDAARVEDVVAEVVVVVVVVVVTGLLMSGSKTHLGIVSIEVWSIPSPSIPHLARDPHAQILPSLLIPKVKSPQP